MSIDSTALSKYNLEHLATAKAKARLMARADPSDPFTYNRVLTHILNGVCVASDYDVEFRKETRYTEREPRKAYKVDIPCNMKRP